MNESRVLITTYPTAFLHRGGGELELVDLRANLRLLGVGADLYGPTSYPLDRYDVVLHYSVTRTGIDVARAAKAAGKKLVLMPGLWWKSAPGDHEKLCAAEFFELADVIVFKSRSEYENVAEHVTPALSKVAYCRWGVDSCFEESVDRHLFRKTHKLGDYLISLGIVEESKNQLTAIHALRDSQIPLVIVGDYRDRDYYEACVKAAPPHFKFLPHLLAKSEMLRSALHGARAFIEVSLEPPGFSSFEAALSCVPMVLCAGPWTTEHFGATLVQQVDPLSTESIRAGVTAALNTPVPPQLRSNVHNRHLMPQCLEPLARMLSVRC